MAFTTIDDPSAYFKVQLYTGNGSANHAITFDDTDTDMQPDFVWIKNRDTTDAHCLFDAVRGATKLLHLSDQGESTDADTLDSFTTDGFQVDADVKVNTDTEDYVAWCWKANGSGSSNTAGSINTAATSANTTSGFSIIKYVGTQANATLGHGIGIAPKFIFLKGTDQTEDYTGFHIGSGNGLNVVIHKTVTGYGPDASYWQDTNPSATLITIGASTRLNNSGTTYIAYCFADVQGFSKFSSYEGNGNADGTFVYTGFRPAWVMIKGIDGTTNWHIYDDQRLGYNIDNNSQRANLVTADQTDDDIDLFSNGFKIKRNTSALNTSGGTYNYCAFAKAPFVNSNGVPCNAR